MNRQGLHQVTLITGDHQHHIHIPPMADGLGSSANGGELLMLALATCYCNDIYREAAKSGLEISAVEVEVSGDFTAAGSPGENIRYRARVITNSPKDQVRRLMEHTDVIAEVQQTVRRQTAVRLESLEIVQS
jgi:organic hydroperoxide reductase OsmC/OhrA